jgi:glutamate-1-semialdehyde aminotransferase
LASILRPSLDVTLIEDPAGGAANGQGYFLSAGLAPDTTGEIRSHIDELKADADLACRFGIEWLRRGVFVTPGGKLYLSLAHTSADIDEALSSARPALKGALEP